MNPPPEVVHWMFAVGFLFLGLCLLAETIVGREVWRRRSWRAYLWPGVAFLMGIFMWPVMVFFTSSAIHMLAHGVWAQAMMVAGAAQLALVRGKIRSPVWDLTVPFALAVSGAAFLIHETNPWLFSRAAFLHHALGWTALVGALITTGRVFRPRSPVFNAGFALVFFAFAALLFCDRNVAPIFGHLSPLAGAR
ncbi:MAG TPA: hypothetical protein VFT86_10095 [Gaiellaceae bacterium]|nr:hypothetical protein [Gaiellaceae bacterium]